MRFQLPQFINTEVKLVGPLTLRQFLWVASGAIILFVLFTVVPGFWGIVLAIPIGTFFLALAFVKVQDAPLINYVAYMLSYVFGPKKYLFRDEASDQITIPKS